MPNPDALQNLTNNFTTYLIPEDPEQRQKQLDEMFRVFSENQTNFYSPNKTKDNLLKALQSYNSLTKDGQQLKKEEYDGLYAHLFSIYDDVQLDDTNKYPTDERMDRKKKEEIEFPKEKRGLENYIYGLQKLWAFLKVLAGQAAAEGEVYGDMVRNDFLKVFDPAYTDHKKQAVQQAQEAPAQQDPVPQAQEAPADPVEKALQTYKTVRDTLLTEAAQVVNDSKSTYKTRKRSWDSSKSWGTGTLDLLERADSALRACDENKKKLTDNRDKVKQLLEQQAKLAEKGVLKNIEEDKKKLQELDKQLETTYNSWEGELERDVKAQKESLEKQVDELKDAMTAFEAAAAEKLYVTSGHAEIFHNISIAVSEYQKATSATESDCAANLYKACREYLHAHTDNGVSQEEIGGQGTQTGRVRKAAVVRLLEVMEQRAKNERKEFVDAMESYSQYFRDHNSNIVCPELDFDMLKRSLAEHSKAEIGGDNKDLSKEQLTDMQAYAELNQVKEGYQRKHQAAQKKQETAAKKQQAKAAGKPVQK